MFIYSVIIKYGKEIFDTCQEVYFICKCLTNY